MLKEVSKKQLESLFNICFTDYETKMFNMMLDSYKNNKKMIICPARAGNRKILNCFNIYIAIKDGIKPNLTFFEELIAPVDEKKEVI